MDAARTLLALLCLLASSQLGLEGVVHMEGDTIYDLTHVPRTFTFKTAFQGSVPVVILGPVSWNEAEVGLPVLVSKSTTSFSTKMWEPTCEDGVHAEEMVSWLALPEGRHTTDQGVAFQVRTITIAGSTPQVPLNWVTVSYPEAFGTDRIVIVPLIQNALTQWTNLRVTSVNRNSFRIHMESETRTMHHSGSEILGYLAIPEGTGSINGRDYNAKIQNIAGIWNHYAFTAMGAQLHGYNKPMPGYFASITHNGADTATLRMKDWTATSVKLRTHEPESCGFDGPHMATETVYLLLFDVAAAVPATCNIQNSNKVPGPSCACLDGYAGSVSWQFQTPTGTCTAVPCAVENSNKAPGPACACNDGYNGTLTWSGVALSGDCPPAECNVPNSNYAPGPACACLDGFAGVITWRGIIPQGQCTAVPCPIENSNNLAGPECVCLDGYNGTIIWKGPALYGSCFPAVCDIENSDHVYGPTCMCADGYDGKIQWIREVAFGNCSFAPCNVKNSNNLPGPECSCDDGYNGTVTWDRTVPSGDCQPALCEVEFSTRMPGLSCVCKDGYNDTIAWLGTETIGACNAERCDVENSNGNPGPPCACLAGYGGTIRWSENNPSGKCLPIECWVINTNNIPGPKCDCLDGYVGQISWSMTSTPLTGTGLITNPPSRPMRGTGPITRTAPFGEVTGTVTRGVPVGICSPAPCGIEFSNNRPGPACMCDHGYSGLIAWKDTTPYGNCTAAECNVENSNKQAGATCACLPGFVGTITWVFDTAIGPCNPIGETDAIITTRSSKAPAPQATTPDFPKMTFIEGSKTVTVNVGSTFSERGPKCRGLDGNLRTVSLVSSNVDMAKIGTYQAVWSCTDPVSGGKASIIREVIVVDGTPPTLTLEGDALVTIEAGKNFVDPGAKCEDGVDGPLVPVYKVNVQPNRVGSYYVKYSCTDLAGNAISLSRLVDVVDTTAPDVSLDGGSTVVIRLGEVLGNRGIQCLDSVDGALTPTLASTTLVSKDDLNGTLEGDIVGAFEETWDCADSHNNKAVVVRTIIIMNDLDEPQIYGAYNPYASTTPEPVLLEVSLVMNLSSADADVLLANKDKAKAALATAHEEALGLPSGSVEITKLEYTNGALMVVYEVTGVEFAEYRSKRKAVVAEEVVIGSHLAAIGLPVKVHTIMGSRVELQESSELDTELDSDPRAPRTMFSTTIDTTSHSPGTGDTHRKMASTPLFLTVIAGGTLAIAASVLLFKIKTKLSKNPCVKASEEHDIVPEKPNEETEHFDDTEHFPDIIVCQLALSHILPSNHNNHAKEMHRESSREMQDNLNPNTQISNSPRVPAGLSIPSTKAHL